MRWLIKMRIVLFLFGFLCPVLATADCERLTQYTPARLIDNLEMIEVVGSLFDSWGIADIPPFVRAGVLVRADGTSNICCLSSSRLLSVKEDDRLLTSMEELEFSPATRSGEPTTVFLGISVLNRFRESRTETKLVLNRLESAAALGVDYIAPQRMITERILPLGPGTYTHVLGVTSVAFPKSLWGVITTNVDEHGRASDSYVSRHEFGPKSVLHSGARKMNEQCFIPGSVEGQQIAMPYSEVFIRR